MEKITIITLLTTVMLATAGCGSNGVSGTEIIGGADGPTSIYLVHEAGEDAEAGAPAGKTSLVTGTWQTSSIAYTDEGTMQPEYYVQFTESDIIYGHMNKGLFITDHADEIKHFDETAEGKYCIQAVSSGGVQYTYRTSESDNDVLEYYETWTESDFPDTYSGGASLTRIPESAGLFVESTNAPDGQDLHINTDKLRNLYPEFFDDDRPPAKGIEVYVWQMAENSFSCGLMYGTNREKTDEEIWSLQNRSISIDEAKAILNECGVTKDEVIVIPIHQPYSSYMYEIDDAYCKYVTQLFR